MQSMHPVTGALTEQTGVSIKTSDLYLGGALSEPGRGH